MYDWQSNVRACFTSERNIAKRILRKINEFVLQAKESNCFNSLVVKTVRCGRKNPGSSPGWGNSLVSEWARNYNFVYVSSGSASETFYRTYSPHYSVSPGLAQSGKYQVSNSHLLLNLPGSNPGWRISFFLFLVRDLVRNKLRVSRSFASEKKPSRKNNIPSKDTASEKKTRWRT